MFDMADYTKQVIDNKISYISNRAITLKYLKKHLGTKPFNAFPILRSFQLDTSLQWLREHKPDVFNDTILNGLGDMILTFRIEKNRDVIGKRAMLLRDINYQKLFGIERALELHPCYFDNY